MRPLPDAVLLQCADFDECERSSSCGPSAKCINREGGHDCECPVGYQGDPYSRSGCQVSGGSIGVGPSGRHTDIVVMFLPCLKEKADRCAK